MTWNSGLKLRPLWLVVYLVSLRAAFEPVFFVLGHLGLTPFHQTHQEILSRGKWTLESLSIVVAPPSFLSVSKKKVIAPQFSNIYQLLFQIVSKITLRGLLTWFLSWPFSDSLLFTSVFSLCIFQFPWDSSQAGQSHLGHFIWACFGLCFDKQPCSFFRSGGFIDRV